MRLWSLTGPVCGVLAVIVAVTTSPAVSTSSTEPAPIADAAPPVLLATGVWSAWRDRFVLADGRVLDDGNGGISHSEGQGYGMLLAVFADDRPTFDRIWQWTHTRLQVREDGLFAWRYDPAANPPIADPNNATDGDALIAWALVAAHDRWHHPDYRMQAASIARAIARETIIEASDGKRLLLPGVTGFNAPARPDGPVVNLSYWVFPAFRALARVAPEYDWKTLERSGLELLETARFGRLDLPSDWIALGPGGPRPADGFQPVFGYNAIRIPLYLAWAGIGERQHLAAFAALWPEGGASDPVVIDAASGMAAHSFGDVGYRAVPAIVACALEGHRLPDAMKTPEMDRYYPATLRLLALAAAAERFPTCL